VQGAPAAYAYVVTRHAGAWYAGFAEHGVWTAQTPPGPWQPLGLAGRTVLDLAAGAALRSSLDAAAGAEVPVSSTSAGNYLLAGTDDGVHLFAAGAWQRLPSLPPAGEEDNAADADFAGRLWLSPRGELVVRSEDRLFQWAPPGGEDTAKQDPLPLAARGAWLPFGPPELAGRLLTLAGCCGEGTFVGSNGAGIWQQGPGGSWQRIDDGFFDNLEINDLAIARGTVYAGAANGLFARRADGGWAEVAGLPATITDLVASPQDPNIWLAATPAGIYRSTDAGLSWQAVSPPWIVWDLAWGPDGALWAARSAGAVFTTDLAATTTGSASPAAVPAGVIWHTPESMNTVLFFTVSPDPAAAGHMWGGTWGNNVGVASGDGMTIQPLHNGLETLSVLAILRHPTPGQYTIGTIAGLFRSDNGGASWFKLPGPLTAQTIYALYQDAAGVIWAGAADGIWRSDDYGGTWHMIPRLPPTAFIRFGEVQWAGAPLLWAGTEESGIWLSADGGDTWQFGGLAGRSVYALIADAARSRLLAATDAGLQMGD
jgi:hypothetical protein